MNTVSAAYMQYYVHAALDVDASVIGDDSDGLVSLLGPHGLAVHTGIHSGPVSVVVEVLDSVPERRFAGWQAVSEVDLICLGDALHVLGWAGEALAGSPFAAPEGFLRARVSARGRAQGRRLDSTTEVVEDYLLQVWPSGKLTQPVSLLRDEVSDAYGGDWTVTERVLRSAWMSLDEVEEDDEELVDLAMDLALPVDVQLARRRLADSADARDPAALVQRALGLDPSAAGGSAGLWLSEVALTVQDVDPGTTRLLLTATPPVSAATPTAVVCRWWLLQLEQTVLDSSPEAVLAQRWQEERDRSPYQPDIARQRPRLAALMEAGGPGAGLASLDPELTEALLDASPEVCIRAAREVAIWLAVFSGITRVPYVPAAVEALAQDQDLPPPFDVEFDLWTEVSIHPHELMPTESVPAVDASHLTQPHLAAFSALLAARSARTKNAALELLQSAFLGSGQAGYRTAINLVREALGLPQRDLWFGDDPTMGAVAADKG